MDGRGAPGVSGRRVPIAELKSGEETLEGAVAHYLARVLRLRAGDCFVAFDPARAREADASVLRAEGSSLSVRVGPIREPPVHARRELTIIQALAKGEKCDAIVRDATELGATRISMATTRRTVVKLDPSRAHARQERWARIAEQAARQSGRSDTPVIEAPAAWGEAIARVTSTCRRFCLWERAVDPLGPPLFDALSEDTELAFACGPEGGLEPAEVALARDLGWTVASLGTRTLRTETVAAAVLGAVQVWGDFLRNR